MLLCRPANWGPTGEEPVEQTLPSTGCCSCRASEASTFHVNFCLVRISTWSLHVFGKFSVLWVPAPQKKNGQAPAGATAQLRREASEGPLCWLYSFKFETTIENPFFGGRGTYFFGAQQVHSVVIAYDAAILASWSYHTVKVGRQI